MEQSLTLVVGAVVLIVVALLVISIVSGGLGNFAKSQNEQITSTSRATASATATAYCQTQDAGGADLETVYYTLKDKDGEDVRCSCDEILNDGGC